MQGKVWRLSAPSYESSRGIRLAGQTFDGSTDGSIKGTYKADNINRVGNAFEVTVSPVMAAVLEYLDN